MAIQEKKDNTHRTRASLTVRACVEAVEKAFSYILLPK